MLELSGRSEHTIVRQVNLLAQLLVLLLVLFLRVVARERRRRRRKHLGATRAVKRAGREQAYRTRMAVQIASPSALEAMMHVNEHIGRQGRIASGSKRSERHSIAEHRLRVHLARRALAERRQRHNIWTTPLKKVRALQAIYGAWRETARCVELSDTYTRTTIRKPSENINKKEPLWAVIVHSRLVADQPPLAPPARPWASMPPIPIDEPVDAAKLRPSPPKACAPALKGKRERAKQHGKKAKTTSRESSSLAVKSRLAVPGRGTRAKKQAMKKRKAVEAAAALVPMATAHKLVQCALPWVSHACMESSGMSFASSSHSPASAPGPSVRGEPAMSVELPRSNYFMVCAAASEQGAPKEPPFPLAVDPSFSSSSASSAPPSPPQSLDPGLCSSAEALQAELAAIRAEMAALRFETQLERGDDGAGGGLIGVSKLTRGTEETRMDMRMDASTQVSLPWRGHGGWLMTPGWNATTRPMGKVYDV